MHPGTVLYFLAQGPGVDMDTLFWYGALKEGIDTQILLNASPVRWHSAFEGIGNWEDNLMRKRSRDFHS